MRPTKTKKKAGPQEDLSPLADALEGIVLQIEDQQNELEGLKNEIREMINDYRAMDASRHPSG